MPELPEVEIAKRGLEPYLLGHQIDICTLNAPALRYPFGEGFANALSGASVQNLERRGKFILVHLDTAQSLIWHLGMSGRIKTFAAQNTYQPEKHDHVVMSLKSGGIVIYNDPRRFGFLRLVPTDSWQQEMHFKDMGPEPLGNNFNGPALAAALKGRSTPIKIALLDQRIVAGIGNIYASEALYMAGMNPLRKAGDIRGKNAENLVQCIRAVLEKAIMAGGSSLRDYQHTDGSLGYFQHMFGVYDRAGRPCPNCNCDIAKTGGIQKIVQGGRSTFYCPRRQK